MDWLVVISPDNFGRTMELGFSVQGFKSRHGRKVSRMAVGDRLTYYLTGESLFAAACTVQSTVFEERTRIWRAPGRPDELYPWRVRISPDVVVPPDRRPRASDWVAALQFVTRWPKAHWPLAFQGMLHEIPASDADTICAALVGKHTD